jgi:hypothetical protein
MFGCPAVTLNDFSHQMPEFEAIHPGITGDFFEHGSVESLADVIRNWFDLNRDRQQTRLSCFNEIDTQWTPVFQYNAIVRAFNEYDGSLNLKVI